MSNKLQSDVRYFAWVAPSGKCLQKYRQAWCNLQVKLSEPSVCIKDMGTWRYL